MADSSRKYYQFVYYTVAPEFYCTFETELKKKLKFIEKGGAKIFAAYKAAVGAVGEYLYILELDKPEQLTLFQSLIDDPEYQKFHANFGKMISNVNIYVTMCLPFYPLSPADSKHMVSVRRYDVKGHPYEAVHDFKACNDAVYKAHIQSRGVSLIGTFMPVYGENTNSYFALWDCGTGTNAITANEGIGKAIFLDQSAKDLTKKMWDHVLAVSSKHFISVEY